MRVILDGKVKSVEIRVTTTGGAGVSTGNTTSPQIVGQILDCEVIWHASAPATADIIVEGATSGIDLYAKANAQVSVKKTIAVFPTDPASATGAALSGALLAAPVCFAEPIKVTVNQCDDLTDAVIVRVTYRTVRCEVVKVTTAGGAGVATGAASTNPFTGEILGFLIDYGAVPAGTNDIVITGATTGRQLYAHTDTATDVFVCPGSFSLDLAGSALGSDITPRNLCVGEAVTVTLNQSDPLATAATVYVFYFPVKAETLRINTTGTAGSATGSATTTHTPGEVLGIYIDYSASAPVTTDIVIAGGDNDANHTPGNIYALANSVTDAYVIPGRFAVTNADGALTSMVTPSRPYYGHPITASLAQCDPLTDAAKVTIFSWYGS
jgi:hypothetical protein